MRHAIIILITLVVPAIAHAATLKVPSQHPTIQAAINAASAGDTVLVAPGTYVENIDFIGKAIILTSEQGADVTVIDGNDAGSVVSCQNGEGADSVLDGFTITNGFATDGGGMYNLKSSPTVTSCTFSKNRGKSSGGMGNTGSNPMVTNCTFSGNHSGVPGSSNGAGGMGNTGSNPIVTNCTFSGNNGKFSGGMCNTGSNPTVTNCTFSGNSGNSSFFFTGGGMLNEGSSPTVTNCTFSGNSACIGGYSGGMGNYYSSPTVMNCTFSGNSATHGGGGMHNYHSSPMVTSCILWDDIPNEIFNYNCSPIVTYTCIKGGYTGTGNIDSDPLFVDPGYWDDNGTPSNPYDDFWVDGDYHLTFNSPCRGSGDNTGVLDLYDFEGDPRIAYGTVDMGADEFYTHLYWTGDATPGGNVEVKFVGLPGTTPVGLCIGTGVLDPPIPSMWGDWYLQFPILGPVDMGSITSPEGVLIVPGIIPASPPPPYSHPMQALIGAELTNLSVLEVK